MSESRNPQIGILNLSSHENFLYDTSFIASGVGDVTVFTTLEIHDRIAEDLQSAPVEIEQVTKSPSVSEASFLSKVEHRTKTDLDVIIAFPFYGTVFDYLSYDSFDPQCPFALFAYDLNGWLGRNPGFTPKFYNYFKYPLKRRFLKRVSSLLVELDPIREYTDPHLNATDVRTFTPVCYREDTTVEVERQTGDESLVVTVPGMIDRSRREYETVLAALEGIPDPYLTDFELVLLGGAVGEYGKKILERADGLRVAGATVVDFEGWIPTQTFTRHLARSDILVSPLRPTRQIDGFVEEYGRSKGSGAISDAIREAIPLLLPAWYDVPARMMSGIQTYEGADDLARKLKSLITGGTELQELQERARDLAETYTVTAQRERFREIIRETM